MYLSSYTEPKPHYVKRIVWTIVNATIFRMFPGIPLRYVRNALLKSFGAQLPWKTLVYESCRIWAPWNLIVEEYVCIGPHTDIYNKDIVTIGKHVVISQNSTLCTAGHDICSVRFSLTTSPIIIRDRAWIASHAFIGPGVTIGEGAVVGATASVFKDVEPWTVVGGNPAKVIKKREICR